MRIKTLLNRGTNGDRFYTSIGGRTQGDRTPASGPMKACAALLTGAALSAAVVLIVVGWRLGNVAVVGALAAVAALADRSRVRVGARSEASITLVPTLVAAVLFGPLAAMLVSALSLADRLRRPFLKWLTYTSTNCLAGVAAAFAAIGARDLWSSGVSRFVVATLAGSVVAEAMDLSFVALVSHLRGMNVRTIVKTYAPLQSASALLYGPVVAGLVYAYHEVSGWTLVFFFGPALAVQRLYGLYQDQRTLAEELASANVRLERANLSFATALVATLDARDRYTAGHSAAVAIYARDIAERLDLPEDERQLAHLCGLVHDIGKIGLPPGLLEKPGALTLGERRQMERHSEIGERILANVEDYAEIAHIVRHHHERWDGQGYPDGIAEHEIPLISRIIAVADAYNAMTSDRPYRDAMPSRVARMRLAQGVESQFDTTIVAAFEAILAGADEEYRTGTRADFSLADQDLYSEPAAVAAEPEPESEPAEAKPIADVA
ncbi:MAG TPA: HD-GYP domain-containing protein [Gaiellaceae bacterium]|nr:HD-GYP domain-containing protein [Gaiellaceae bacterium]